MSRKCQNIVIDASVARSAGETTHPVSKSCRGFLEEFRLSNNKLVMSKTIFSEWKKHQSRFSLTWRASIVASKRMVLVDDAENVKIRTDVERFVLNDKAKTAVLKDIHLVEAAIQADEIVISCDNKMRELLCTLSGQSTEIKDIVWVNPVNDYESASDWLQKGCERDDVRKLVHFSSGKNNVATAKQQNKVSRNGVW
jgi:hypothetical protein